METISAVDFNMGLAQLEKHTGKKYSSSQVGRIQLGVLDDMTPTSDEWIQTVEQLQERSRGLPGLETIKQKLRRVQKETTTRTAIVRVPCDTCRTTGHLRWKPDWNRIRATFPDDDGLMVTLRRRFGDDAEKALEQWNYRFASWKDSYKGVRFIVIACGCDNTPKHATEESKFNEHPRAERMKAYNIHLAQKAAEKKESHATCHTAPMWMQKQLIERGWACIADFHRMDKTAVFGEVSEERHETEDAIF